MRKLDNWEDMEYNPDWIKFRRRICKEDFSGILSVLILGPKNSGKTTYLLSIIQCILRYRKDNPSIYVLDCDLGQPLIAPIACLKLVKWYHYTTPINISNQFLLPELMFFIGGNSPIVNPIRYLEGIKHCIEYMRQLSQENNVILLINMPGWVTGIGLEIASIITALCVSVSTKVLVGFTKSFGDTINNENSTLRQSDNMQLVTANFLSYPSINLSIFKNKTEIFCVQNIFETKVIIEKLQDISDFINKPSIYIKSNKKSNIMDEFANYIGYTLLENNMTLFGGKTLSLPFDLTFVVPAPNTSIMDSDSSLHIPYRLTNAIVALCICRETEFLTNSKISKEVSQLIILHSSVLYPCIGLGIIHHLDYSSKYIVIQTPNWISDYILNEINIVQLTEMMLPLNSANYTHKPYLCPRNNIISGMVSGSKVPINRKNVKRKILKGSSH
ncbi:hypothetical protein ACR3K2_04580 [Cryptosporidium serpentis]